MTVGRKSGTMGPSYPKNEIGNQSWTRCCGRVARFEPHIASETKSSRIQDALAHVCRVFWSNLVKLGCARNNNWSGTLGQAPIDLTETHHASLVGIPEKSKWHWAKESPQSRGERSALAKINGEQRDRWNLGPW